MKHTSITRMITCFLLCAVLLSVLCIIPVSAASDTVTIGKGKTTIGPRDTEDYYFFSGTIEIAEGVTEIRAEAFEFFHAKAIKLPKSLKTIGKEAFYGCQNISEITVPKSVTSIGEDAFSTCTNLKTMYYNAKNCTYEGEYSGILGLYNKLETLVIGLGVEAIPKHAFETSTSLKSLSVPGNVKTIGDKAFYECSALQTLNLGDGIEVIGEQAFYYCSSLTEITIPTSVTKIGLLAFSACDSLENIYIEDTSLLAGTGFPEDTLINGEKQSPDLFEFLKYPSVGSAWGVFGVIYLIIWIVVLLMVLAINIIYLIGNLKLNNRYRCITGKDAAWMTVLAVILSLIGFGMWYMLVIAIINHSEAQKLQ